MGVQHVSKYGNVLLVQETKERPQLKTVNLSEFLPPQTPNSTVWNIFIASDIL